jgi:hypothetical protein
MTRKSKACPYCGAPVLSEVCQYCGGRIEDANTTELSAEYETIDCRNASLSFWTTLFPLVFAVMFGFFGFIFPVFLDQSPQDKFSVWFCIPFAMVSVGAWAVIIYTLYKYFLVSTKGKEITGTVYGYMDDTVQYNHRPGQICKILIDTRKGKKFIFYSILGTNKPYPVNSKLRLKAYRNYFMVLENTNEDLF